MTHDPIKQVREALEKLAKLGNEPHDGNSIGNVIAQEALFAVSELEKRIVTECCHAAYRNRLDSTFVRELIELCPAQPR